MPSLGALLLSLLPALATAAPTEVGNPNWTMQDFTRQCGRDACRYSYRLSQEGRNGGLCRFTIRGGPTTPFGPTRCDGSNRYLTQAGFDAGGQFTTVVVTDTKTRMHAYFGFDESEMAGGRACSSRSSPARRLGTYSTGRSIDSEEPDTAGGSEPFGSQPFESEPVGNSGRWAIRRIQRQVGNNVVYMIMYIDTGAGIVPCELQVPVEGDPRTASFFNQRCLNAAGWRVSWGYNGEKDSAVATVTSPEGRMAWFGWDYINQSETLGQVGPNIVEYRPEAADRD